MLKLSPFAKIRLSRDGKPLRVFMDPARRTEHTTPIAVNASGEVPLIYLDHEVESSPVRVEVEDQ